MRVMASNGKAQLALLPDLAERQKIQKSGNTRNLQDRRADRLLFGARVLGSCATQPQGPTRSFPTWPNKNAKKRQFHAGLLVGGLAFFHSVSRVLYVLGGGLILILFEKFGTPEAVTLEGKEPVCPAAPLGGSGFKVFV